MSAINDDEAPNDELFTELETEELLIEGGDIEDEGEGDDEGDEARGEGEGESTNPRI